MEAKVATYLHPAVLQTVLLDYSMWRHQVGCWMPDPVKQQDRSLRRESGDIRVGSEEASLQRPTLQPTSVPPSG